MRGDETRSKIIVVLLSCSRFLGTVLGRIKGRLVSSPRATGFVAQGAQVWWRRIGQRMWLSTAVSNALTDLCSREGCHRVSLDRLGQSISLPNLLECLLEEFLAYRQ